MNRTPQRNHAMTHAAVAPPAAGPPSASLTALRCAGSPRRVFGLHGQPAAGQRPAPQPPPATPVSVATVERERSHGLGRVLRPARSRRARRRALARRRRGAGRAFPRRRAGRSKGDLLITIDPAPYAAEVERAEAQVAAAQARLSHAQQRARACAAPVGRAGHRPARVRRARERPARSRRQPARGAGRSCRAARLNLGYTQVRAPVVGPHRQARSHRGQPGGRRPRRAGADHAGLGQPDLRQLRRRRAGHRRARSRTCPAAPAPAPRSSASRCRWAPRPATDTPYEGRCN